MTYTEAIINLPPEARAILDFLFGRYTLPTPAINGPNDNYENSPCSISWSYRTFYIDFTWNAVDGYEWFATDRTRTGPSANVEDVDYAGSSTGDMLIPVSPKAEVWIKRFFPQTFEDFIFGNACLEKE